MKRFKEILPALLAGVALIGICVLCFWCTTLEDSEYVVVNEDAMFLVPIIGSIFGVLGIAMIVTTISGHSRVIKLGENHYAIMTKKQHAEYQEELANSEPKAKFCCECGKPVKSGDVFCKHCGKEVRYDGQIR